MIDETQKEQEQLTEELVAEESEPKPAENLMEVAEQEVTAEEAEKIEAQAKEKAKPKKKEEDIVEEKTYTIPLSKALIMPPRKRSPRAMRIVRAFIIKHMKIPSRAEEEDEQPPTLTITKEVNERIWSRGIEKPPRKIRVRATKDSDGNVTVHLAEGD